MCPYSIGRGEIVALIGRSGSGKSTVLRVLAGLSTDHTGERVVVRGAGTGFPGAAVVPVARRAHQCRSTASPAAGCPRRRRWRGPTGRWPTSGLTDRADVWPLTLSGGQAQRVSLARALVAEPELLLLDEPFGALDALTRLSMRALLLDLWREHGFGVLLVTHDVDEAVALADRVLVLDEGRSHPHPGHRRTADGRRTPTVYRTELLEQPRCAHLKTHDREGDCHAQNRRRARTRGPACSTGCVTREESSGAKAHPQQCRCPNWQA